jgi:flagellar hook assembly protein FlgD
LVRPARARVEVVNTSGERVATLADQIFASGQHVIPWDGLDATGRRVASGVYFSRVEAEGRAVSRKLIVAR